MYWLSNNYKGVVARRWTFIEISYLRKELKHLINFGAVSTESTKAVTVSEAYVVYSDGYSVNLNHFNGICI